MKDFKQEAKSRLKDLSAMATINTIVADSKHLGIKSIGIQKQSIQAQLAKAKSALESSDKRERERE